MSQVSNMNENLKAFLLIVVIPIACVLILWLPALLWKLAHG